MNADLRDVLDVDPYDMPTVRRAIVGIVKIELRVRQALVSLRHVDHWALLTVFCGLLASTVRSLPLILAFGFLLILQVGMWLAEQRRFALANIGETDSLSGSEFELGLCGFLSDLGVDVGHIG